MRRGGYRELYYCNMVEWFWWDLSPISTTSWFNRPRNDLQCVEWDVKQPTNLCIGPLYTYIFVPSADWRINVFITSSMSVMMNNK